MNWGRKDRGTPWLLSGSHVSWRPLVRTHRGLSRCSPLATHLGCLPRLRYVFNLKSTDADGNTSQRKRRTLLHHSKVVAAPRTSLVFPSPRVQGESLTRFNVQPKLKLVQQVGVASSVPEHEVGVACSAPEHEVGVACSTPEHKLDVASSVPEHEVGSEVRLSPQHRSSADDCFSFLLLGTMK